jgi:hypothetical protein
MYTEFGNAGLQGGKIAYDTITATVTLSNTAASDVNIKTASDVQGVQAYAEIGAVQPSTSGTGLLLLTDSGANFPTLDSNADPTVWGVLVTCKDADTTFNPIIQVLRKPSAATDTISLRGTSTTGVTASKNIAFSISSAGIDLDSGASTYSWTFLITYKRILNTVATF